MSERSISESGRWASSDSLRLRAGVIGLSADVLRTSFVISASLLSGGSAGGDEADHFVRTLFPNGVSDEQQNHSSSQAERAPTRLAHLVGHVLVEQCIGILKDVHGVLEGDAMFSPVDPRLH